MSYPKEFESSSILPRHPLDSDAAELLGHLLIASSRLDLAVQLYLDNLARVAGRVPAAAATPEERLEQLFTFADALADKAMRDGFMQWMVRAHQVAQLRLALRAGRWLPDLRSGNVLMLAPPGLQDLGPRSWELLELNEASVMLSRLLRDLQKLCAAERGLTLANASKFLSTQPIGVSEEAAP